MSPTLVRDKPLQRKKPRQRAFTGLVGRDSPDDFSARSEPAARLPPFDPERDYADALVRFQEYAFDPGLRGIDPKTAYDGDGKSSSKPKGPTSASGDPDGNDKRVPAGLSVITIKAETPRQRIPWWIRDETVFNEFLLSLINDAVAENEVHILTGRELRDAAGLDYKILYEFYFAAQEDEQIFERHKEDFKKETGRQRRTSSIAAVKKRRQRLIEQGQEMYGSEARPVEGTEHKEHRARWASIRLGPDIKTGRNENT
jgi:hypothetical protein